MEIIYFRGLNCHIASLVTVANFLGVNYLDAFATLWSETDFFDVADYNIYESKRAYVNLELMGIVAEVLDCMQMKREEGMSRIPDGAALVVGMDTFDAPWHPVYRHFHDRHYFSALKETARSVLCFDPVYNERNQRLTPDDIVASAFELFYVHRVETIPPDVGLLQEATAVLRCHPQTREKMLTEIALCKAGGRNTIYQLIKPISAMINNRYLYQRYLSGSASVEQYGQFSFDESFLRKWDAVQNGLYRAAIAKDNGSVIDEVHSLFDGLMQEEMDMAKRIVYWL